MQVPSPQSAYTQYLQTRLAQIQSFILSTKKTDQSHKLLQQRISQGENKLAAIEGKIRWIQMAVQDGMQRAGKIEMGLAKVWGLVGRVEGVQGRVGKCEGMIKKVMKQERVKDDIQELEVKTNEIQDLKTKMIATQHKISQLQHHLTYLQHKIPVPHFPIAQTLPSQILATKKDLRESIQLIHEIYEEKISKIERKVKKIRASGTGKGSGNGSRGKRTVILVGDRRETDQYDLFRIQDGREEREEIEREKEEDSHQNLKPLALTGIYSLRKEPDYDRKIRGFYRKNTRNQSRKSRHSLSSTHRKSTPKSPSTEKTRHKNRPKPKKKSPQKFKSL